MFTFFVADLAEVGRFIYRPQRERLQKIARNKFSEQVAACGYRNIIGDFEAYSRSLGKDGKPLRPEIYELEHSDEVKFYNFGYNYDMPGDEMAIHYPFKNIEGLPPDTMRCFWRSDSIAQPGERFFMCNRATILRCTLT